MESFSLSFLIPCFTSFIENAWSFTLVLALFYIFISLLNQHLAPRSFAWRKDTKNTNKNHIIGPIISWPFLGFLPQMGSQAHRKLANMALKLHAKRLMAISLGSSRVIISTHPETAKEILCGNAFCDRPITESTRILMFDRAIGFSPSGGHWRHIRKLASSHMFSPNSISTLEGLRQSVADKMIDKVREEMNTNSFVDLRGILQQGSLIYMFESVFGSSTCDLGFDEKNDLGFMVKEGYELIGQFNWADYFHLGVFDFYGVKRRCRKLAARVKELVSKMIKQRRNAGDFRMRSDFLSALLSLPEEDKFSDADMVPILWEMVFRGVDNVAVLLEWIMARLILHQDVQRKVQQEVDSHISQRKPIQDSDISNLPYLQAIVKEVSRLHPPGPLLSWARLSTRDTFVDNCFIPVGTIAMVNMWAISHDPTIWADPSAFRPKRFIEQDFSIMGSDLRLAPFGAGRRVCPGKALALATVHLWLAKFVQEFKWMPRGHVDLGECLKLSLELKNPLVCCADTRVEGK